jgi:ATP-dependent helicase HepA
MDTPFPGQRWTSDTEPELGLGTVLKVAFGRLDVFFPASGELRQYAMKSAPLRRVRFKEGDTIKSHDGASLVVNEVIEKDGLLTYQCAERDLPEAELSDSISFSKPEDRLLTGIVDELDTFALRVEALQRRSEMRQSPVRGYVGARVDLISHQMSIASEVASRLVPRVLLADEVGLGKTIEAGLILHRLHLTGRADRVLILVPEPLIHQWFVELLRKFNLLFSIFDEERCESIEANDEAANPFLDSQLVLCSATLLTRDERRTKQILAAGWDLLVVDEAHHLEWTPQAASPAYALVEALAQKTAGLLLLTATPQQLGPEGHFARLRLLDPDRHNDLARFLAEAGHYEQVAQAVDRLLEGKPLSKADESLFSAKSPRIRRHAEALQTGDKEARECLIADLLDEFGMGRVMFRNTRAALQGFPKRKAILHPLAAASEDEPLKPKLKWLAALLQKLGEEKVLLICQTRELVEAIYEGLQQELNIGCAMFHEGLSLLQRDRNAAHFASEEGARILICSEIGSEGRNFQFAHHLVLFDLPRNPELLEQRIGRLDRIGQTSTIEIHVPHYKGTAEEVLASWYHDGLNAFEKNLHGAAEIARMMERDVDDLLATFDAKALKALITASRKQATLVGKRLEKGHDRLLELNSHRPAQAAKTIHQIKQLDSDTGFEDFMIRLLDHHGMNIEDMAQRSHALTPGNEATNALPSMPDEGMSVTFDRARALSREDWGFLTVDHPLVRGSIDLLLSGESGNSAFAIWKGSGSESLLLEAWYVAECIAPASLHVDRFLPATPIRIMVDHAQADKTAEEPPAPDVLGTGNVSKLLDRGPVKKKILPGMLSKASTLAEEKLQSLITSSSGQATKLLQDEAERLQDLKALNDHVQQSEIDAALRHKEETLTALQGTRLRLDALRLIWQML